MIRYIKGMRTRRYLYSIPSDFMYRPSKGSVFGIWYTVRDLVLSDYVLDVRPRAVTHWFGWAVLIRICCLVFSK